jgi:hypothetical protein
MSSLKLSNEDASGCQRPPPKGAMSVTVKYGKAECGDGEIGGEGRHTDETVAT